MKSRQISRSPDTFVVVFDAGDQLLQVLNEFVSERNLSASSFKAIGA
jgi:predicted DNA-binding protein with PD1-like motif